jgi:hypothetical protein
MKEPSPELVAAAMRALCAALNDQYPHLHATPREAGRPAPRGSRSLPGAIVVGGGEEEAA